MTEHGRPVRCEGCGGKPLGHGTRTVAVPIWTSGVLEWRDHVIARFRCRSCGRISENLSAAASVKAETMHFVAKAYAQEGPGIADRLGVDAKTVATWVEEWVSRRRIPYGMAASPFVRRSRKSSTIMVFDAETGWLAGIVADDRDGLRELAETTKLDKLERVLVEFDVEIYEAFEDVGIGAVVHPEISRRYLDQVVADLRGSMESALVAEEVANSGWNARSVGLLKAFATSRTKVKLDMWADAITDGLEAFNGVADVDFLHDARCNPLRMMAICTVLLEAGHGFVAAKDVNAAIGIAGLLKTMVVPNTTAM